MISNKRSKNDKVEIKMCGNYRRIHDNNGYLIIIMCIVLNSNLAWFAFIYTPVFE